mgnify:CR=1 FL=1|tara:strand:+ start:164 stop:448 length:285 start_codon:yes stop_codon:yes gene_type:complete
MKRTLKVMDSIAYGVLALGMAGVLTVVYGPGSGAKDDCGVASAGQPFMKVTEVPRRKECICRELAEVVQENAYDGLITYAQAERMVQHCWRTEF